jgi:hypothetical protein
MAPSLALTYSSQAPIYGGIAAGWSLSGLHDIRWDTSNGRLRYEPQLMAAAPPNNAWPEEPYVSSMGGGRPLVRVDGDPADATVYATYRAQNDAGFVRYQRMQASAAFRWRALTPDGVTHEFGDCAFFVAGCTPELLRVRAPLTRSTDSFGNEIHYFWRFENDELRVDHIDYTVNQNAGVGVLPFARIEFVYGAPDTCAGMPIGAQSDYKTGEKLVDGRSPLARIDVKALYLGDTEHTRQITLRYADGSAGVDTQRCDLGAKHSPFRQLMSLQESAWHTGEEDKRIDLPEIEFEYGSADLSLDAPISGPITWGGAGHFNQNLAWGRRFQGGRWPSVEAMVIDFDGDGRLDRLYNDFSNTCAVQWHRNKGDGTFQPQPSIALPRLPWEDDDALPNGEGGPNPEGCSLNYQRTFYGNTEPAVPGECRPAPIGSYLVYRWMDMNGDGLVELVTAIHHDVYLDPAQAGAPMPGAPWPECPAQGHGSCPALDYECMEDAEECLSNQPCVLKPNHAAACTAAAELVPCHWMTAKLGGRGPVTSGCIDSGNTTTPPTCPPPPPCSTPYPVLRASIVTA